MQIVALSSNEWDGQWMNRQHLMWAMKDHVPVFYVQEPTPWDGDSDRGMSGS